MQCGMRTITELLAEVRGGITDAKAKACLQAAFPGRHVELPREITGDGRPLRTRSGSVRGAVFFPSQAVQMVVTRNCNVHRDPDGQGDL